MKRTLRTVATTAALAATAVAQTTEPGDDRSYSPLYRAQLAELLDRDLDAARAAYREAADDTDATLEESALARARLIELAQLRGDREEIRSLSPAIRPILGARAAAFEPLKLPRDEFARALSMNGAERDSALRAARASVKAGDCITHRFVPATLEQLERLETDTLKTLLDGLQRARDARDTREIADLQRQIRRIRLGDQRRTVRYHRFEVTRRLVQGRTAEARALRRRVGLRDRPRRVPENGRAAFVRRFIGRLDDRITSHGTTARERSILRGLRGRLGQLADDGQWTEAVELIALLPRIE